MSEARINRVQSRFVRIDQAITRIDRKLTLLIWAVGINAAATITMLIKHW
jgi:hypothetical protein